MIEMHETIPDVPTGGMKYCFVVTARSKTMFGAYYLNNYSLECDDCPDATKENGWTSCQGCSDGYGHASTGWFEEQQEHGDRNLYYPLHGVIAWAEPPANPFLERKPPQHERKDNP